jgi:hypothetical protein
MLEMVEGPARAAWMILSIMTFWPMSRGFGGYTTAEASRTCRQGVFYEVRWPCLATILRGRRHHGKQEYRSPHVPSSFFHFPLRVAHTCMMPPGDPGTSTKSLCTQVSSIPVLCTWMDKE